jgi:hypothetical protein
MKPPAQLNETAPGDRVPSPDESPGVPGFRTWRGVYLFVFGCFVLVVILLAVFTRVYA